jgi:hypothetical protein
MPDFPFPSLPEPLRPWPDVFDDDEDENAL